MERVRRDGSREALESVIWCLERSGRLSNEIDLEPHYENAPTAKPGDGLREGWLMMKLRGERL